MKTAGFSAFLQKKNSQRHEGVIRLKNPFYGIENPVFPGVHYPRPL
jgi:hypothetical protein